MKQAELRQAINLIDLGQTDLLKAKLLEKLRYLEIKAIKGGKGAADVKKFKKLMARSPYLDVVGSFVKDGFQYFTDSCIGFRMNPGDFVTWLDDETDRTGATSAISKLESTFDRYPILDKSTLKVDLNHLLDLEDEDAYIFTDDQGKDISVKAFYLRLAVLVLGENATVFLNGANSPIRLVSRLGHCLISPMRRYH